MNHSQLLAGVEADPGPEEPSARLLWAEKKPGLLAVLRRMVLPRQAPRKVGRNDPCPCGSGKKYKKCCLR